MNGQLKRVNAELEEAARLIKRLEGILPICSFCKNIRDEGGEWHRVEEYITDHSEAGFSHGICPSCLEENYPEYAPSPARV